jgi:hypothetical protein
MEPNLDINLSPSEMELVTNASWILAKQKIIRKVFDMLGSLHVQLQHEVSQSGWPDEIKQNNGKIFKGENYLNLPYVIMDYPARFSKTDVFAIRTMFWWGNYFSVTLHTSAKYKKALEENKDSALSFLKEKKFFVCINDEEWEHHFENTNYKPAVNITDVELKDILSRNFFKTGKIIPLTNWNNAPDLIMEYFKEIMELTLNPSTS